MRVYCVRARSNTYALTHNSRVVREREREKKKENYFRNRKRRKKKKKKRYEKT